MEDEVTVEQVKQKKQQMEQAIFNVINNFERIYKLKVEAVRIQHAEYVGGQHELIAVSTEVKL